MCSKWTLKMIFFNTSEISKGQCGCFENVSECRSPFRVSLKSWTSVILYHFKIKTLSFWHHYLDIPLSAMTLLAGFMIALSAEMGLRMGVFGSAMSMITTWACSPTFSRIQMNLSDSMVRVLKPMLAGLIPKFWS